MHHTATGRLPVLKAGETDTRPLCWTMGEQPGDGKDSGGGGSRVQVHQGYPPCSAAGGSLPGMGAMPRLPAGRSPQSSRLTSACVSNPSGRARGGATVGTQRSAHLCTPPGSSAT